MKISAFIILGFRMLYPLLPMDRIIEAPMNKQDCSISEVLKEIEKNSEYTFFLNDNQVNVKMRKTSVKANNA